MSYAQIAQKNFVRIREDGSSITYRITFEQNDVAAADLNVPSVEDIIVTHGERQDQIDKPLKVSKCELQFTDVPASTDLIYRIDGAKPREIRVTVEDVTNSYVEFIGYIATDRTDFQLYESTQRVSVIATGGLQFMETMLADNLTRTIREIGLDVNAAASLSRPVDVMTSLRHSGQIASDPVPNWIRGNQKVMAGNDDDATLLNAVSGMCAAFGWQMFQRNGRLTIAEIYERAFNSSAVNSYIDNGSGTYSQTTQDVRVALNAANVIRGGSFRSTQPIKRRTQQFNMVTRDPVTPVNFNDDTVVAGNTNTLTSNQFVQAGDVLSMRIWGTAYCKEDLPDDVVMTGEFARVTLKSVIGGADIDALSVAQQVAFTTQSGQTSATWGNVNSAVVFEVPEGFYGFIEIDHIYEGFTFTSGSMNDLDRSEADRMTVDVDEVNDGAGELYRFFDASSSDTVGDDIGREFFMSDVNPYTSQQSFEYKVEEIANFEKTDNWIDPDGNAGIGEVTARRLGDVTVGSGMKFDVQIRATQRVDLLTVFTIVDNNGVTHTCLPLEIKHSVLRGFYTVRLREVNDQRNAAADFDIYSLQPRGTAGGSGRGSSGGGGSSAAWGSIFGDIFDQTDLVNALDEKAGAQDLTNHIQDTDNPHQLTPDALGLGETDDVVFKTLRVSDGIIKAPTDIRFENATNTNLRKVHVGDATAGTHALNTNVANNLYDKYNFWWFHLDGVAPEEINSQDTFKIINGGGLNMSFNFAEKALTIENPTAGNNFLSSVEMISSLGDNVIAQYDRSGLQPLTLNMTTDLDARYANILHSHNHFGLKDNPHEVTMSQIGADNYASWTVGVIDGFNQTQNVTSGYTINFEAGNDISLEFVTGTNIKINSTASFTNNFLNGVGFAGTQGEDIIFKYERSGLGDLTLNATAHMKAYFDTQYNNFTYSHPTGFTSQPATATTGAEVISQITVNDNGHVTGVTTRNIPLPFDNYGSFQVQVNSDPSTAVGSGEMLTFIQGSNITLSRTGRQITITGSANTNNYVTSIGAGGTQGENIVIKLDRTGLGSIEHDFTSHMKAYFDTVYNNYSHPSFGSGNQPATALSGKSVISQIQVNSSGHVTGVTSRTLDYDNYNRWELQVNSGESTFVNSNEMVTFQEAGDVTISRSGKTITISASGTGNNYVTVIEPDLSVQGDAIVIRLQRTGLGSIQYDFTSYMKAYFDTVYSSGVNTSANYNWSGSHTFTVDSFGGAITVKRPSANGAVITYENLNGQLGKAGFEADGRFTIRHGTGSTPTIQFSVDENGVITDGGGQTSTRWNTAYTHSQSSGNPHGVSYSNIGGAIPFVPKAGGVFTGRIYIGGTFSNDVVGYIQVRQSGANNGIVLWTESGAITKRIWIDDSADTMEISAGAAANGISILSSGAARINTGLILPSTWA